MSFYWLNDQLHAAVLRLSDPIMTLFDLAVSHTLFTLSYVLHCILLLFWNNAVWGSVKFYGGGCSDGVCVGGDGTGSRQSAWFILTLSEEVDLWVETQVYKVVKIHWMVMNSLSWSVWKIIWPTTICPTPTSMYCRVVTLTWSGRIMNQLSVKILGNGQRSSDIWKAYESETKLKITPCRAWDSIFFLKLHLKKFYFIFFS